MKIPSAKGLNLKGYIVLDGDFKKGRVGSVFLASRDGGNFDNRAVKFIEKAALKEGWENEIKKPLKLNGIPGVVQYHEHDLITIAGEEYIYIMWQYVPNESLKEIIEQRKITIPLLKEVVLQVLRVLHACREMGIHHGDLHSGNILVQDEDKRRLDNVRPIWITDFGYKTSMGSGTLDDFDGLNRIIQDGVRAIDFHSLEGVEKKVFSVFKKDFPIYLQEKNPTEGSYVRNPRLLINKLEELLSIKESAVSLATTRNINDYLTAELIGERFDEWKELFVPHFFKKKELLEFNITVLTGLRGCGKTTIFRRLTALFDLHLGPPGIPEADTFLGFYLSARYLAEAFPWLPMKQKDNARNQIIHYFHLSWSIEIVRWLQEYARRNPTVGFGWIIEFFNGFFEDLLTTSPEGGTTLDFLYSFLTKKLDISRLISEYGKTSWALSDYMYLEKFFQIIQKNCPWTDGKRFFLFLDDYSTPMVTSAMQEILNPIVFRRSSILIFKISTESIESFVSKGLHGKFLEEDHDYVLIDLGVESILQENVEKGPILSAILKPRILRDKNLSKISDDLQLILGSKKFVSTEFARNIRGEQNSSKILYSGYDVFVQLWTSSIREMIRIFADMINKTKNETLSSKFNPENGLVDPQIQDEVLRRSGADFLQLLSSATPPTMSGYEPDDYDLSFGNHLVKIAKSFHAMALYDLKKKDSKNQDNNPPKLVRRIEIKEIGDFSNDKVSEYYKGMLQYGLFVRDNRGKSVGGKVAPRLILRGLLVPYFTLTFSTRDNIMFEWDDFCDFLEHPEDYARKYLNRQENPVEDSQLKFNYGDH